MQKLTRPRLFLVVILVVGAQACYLPFMVPSERPTPAPDSSSLTGVTAEVFTGGNVHVQVQYARGRENEATLTCSYPDGKGGNNQYTHVDQDKDDPGNKTSFDFTLKTNGAYQVTCRMGGSEKSASFTINEPSAEQATAEGSFPKHKPGDFSTAGLALRIEEATSTIPGLMPHHCLPAVNIDADGALTGSCSTTMYGGSEQNTGTLTGRWNGDSGEITLHLETKSVYTASKTRNGSTVTGQTTMVTVFDGKAYFTAEFQAAGMADWSMTCSSSDAAVVACPNSQASLDATGTVPWLLNFNP